MSKKFTRGAIRLLLRGDEKFFPCRHCGEPTALFRAHDGTLAVVNRLGELHIQTCARLRGRLDLPFRLFDDDDGDESDGQLSLF